MINLKSLGIHTLLLVYLGISPMLGATIDLPREYVDREVQVIPIQLIESAEFAYPRDSRLADLPRQGQATVKIRVDETGQLTELLTLEATHSAFAQAAERGLRASRYSPANVDGEPVTGDARVRVEFARTGAVVIISSMEYARTRTTFHRRPESYIGMARVSELDEPLTLVAQDEPPVALLPDGTPIRGEAEIRYYIGRDGRPHLPVVLSSTSIDAARAALGTLETFHYKPPQSEGKLVAVHVRQTFRFDP